MGAHAAWPAALALFAAAVTLATAEFDHQAHAKPGGPYYAVDWDGDGGESVTLDATESHSHYFAHGPPPKSGKIVAYHWVSGHTGKTLINTKMPHISGFFFQGVTILKLTVTDNMGDKASGWTYIQVRKPHKWENKKPVVKSLDPPSGPLGAGIYTVKIEGSNFYNNPKVTFGGVPVEITVESDTEIIARSPKAFVPGKMQVVVTNGFGKSAQKVTYTIKKTIAAAVAFDETTIKNKNGNGDFKIADITCIRIGPDGRYYAGSQNGFIHKFALNRKLHVTDSCKSENVGPKRSVLGINFHPEEWSTPRAYITTSELYWKKNKSPDGWANGDVEVWTSVASAECMAFSHTVITGLPVANHDHGASAIEFANNGDLYISVGGTTNAGIHTNGDQVGGIPESPLSGAILIAKLSLGPKFAGKVEYNQMKDPGTANVVGGSIKVFAAGFRNVFGMTRHSNKHLYAMDNGPNSGYGPAAIGCGKPGPQLAFADKLTLVTEGSYYGHPNFNRGRADKRQCIFRKGDTKGLPKTQFSPPLATLPSSTNGIIEYTANTFGGQMRGNLLLSKLSWGEDGQLYRVQLKNKGLSVASNPTPFLDKSGLSIVMGPFGEIIMPKLKQNKIVAYVPKDDTHEALRVISVTPRRGPAGGVNPVLITGDGFFEGVKIFFNGRECLTYKSRARNSVWCQVPPGKPSETVTVVAKQGGLSSKPSGHSDYEYMAY